MTDGTFEAVLWDLDGVIADTGRYHFGAWRQVFRKKGVSFTAEQFRDHFGRRNDTIIRDAVGTVSPQEMAEIIAEKEELFRSGIAGRITALPGAVELIRALNEAGIKTALATSATPENMRLVIRALGIEDCFQAIAYGREVAEGKPSPDVFLLAAQRLGVLPRNCVVIEDAVAGVAGAKKGGMKCVAVTNNHPASSLREADLIVDSLEALGVKDMAGLFARPA